MGVKVEGVRTGERVAVEDTVTQNRKRLGVALAVGLAVIVLIVVILQLTAGTPTYGPQGHRFQADFGGAPTQSSQAIQSGSLQIANGITGIDVYRYGNTNVEEQVEVSTITNQVLSQGSAANIILGQELPGSHGVSLGGLSGVEKVGADTISGPGTTGLPYSAIAVLIDPASSTQWVISASAASQSDATNFVNSFQLAS